MKQRSSSSSGGRPAADIALRSQLAHCLRALGKTSEAAKQRAAATALSAWAHLESAMAHLTLGRRDLARKHLKRSRELHLVPDPDLVRLQKELTVGIKGGHTP